MSAALHKQETVCGTMNLPRGERRVLVVIMNSRRDLEIARTSGWYRIPLSRAPRQVAADHLAFYQTAAFPLERWHINYYAPVLRYRLATRRELLPEEQGHPRADDLYYRIEIGSLLRLRRPVPSKRMRRITFIPTTLDRLLEAREIGDLWDRCSTSERLWREFRGASPATGRGHRLRDRRVPYAVGPALARRRGGIARKLVVLPSPSSRRIHPKFMPSLPVPPSSTL